MPIEESEPIYQNESNPIYHLSVKCDICNDHLYYNQVYEKRNNQELKNSIVVCPSCTRNIAISDLKALSTD